MKRRYRERAYEAEQAPDTGAPPQGNSTYTNRNRSPYGAPAQPGMGLPRAPYVRNRPPVATPPLPPEQAVTPQPPPPARAAAPAMPRDLNALKRERRQIVNERTNSVVIKEPDNRTIIKRGNQSIIVHDEESRIRRVAPRAEVQRQTDGSNITVIQRPNNVSIYNVTDKNGQLIRRYRRDASGREFDLIDNRRRKNRFGRNLAIGLGIGAGVVAGAAILNSVVDVPPPRIDLPRRKYIVDYDNASEDDVYEAFNAPPVDRIERRYTLDEVRATPYLRDRMRRVDLNDINFDTARWDVAPSEWRKLRRVARAMLRVIDRNPNEVFMIEGYTDAVGSEEDNLTLSDRRAESVAVILTEQFQVPPENLTTQGYGEQYLKVPTEGPERLNRRVAARRITPLLSREDYSERRDERRYDDRRDDERRYDERRYDDGGRDDDGPPPPPRY